MPELGSGLRNLCKSSLGQWRAQRLYSCFQASLIYEGGGGGGVTKLLRMNTKLRPTSSGENHLVLLRKGGVPDCLCIGFDYVCVSVRGMDTQKVSKPDTDSLIGDIVSSF